MKSIKIIVSDFHLCEGRQLADGSPNHMEDFIEDRRFIEFLEYHSAGEFESCEVELVLNGDFMNLIQIPFRGSNPTVITEQISHEKLKLVFSGHKPVFDALRRFNQKAGHKIAYVVGNHDLEMLWPLLKDAFSKEVGGAVRVFNTHYIEDGIHIEHGHQHEECNRVDIKRLFLSEGLDSPILNLPWGSLFIINALLKVKRRYHIIDSVRPFTKLVRWLLLTDLRRGLWMGYQLVSYFVKTRFVRDPYHSRYPTTLAVFSDLALNAELDRPARRILSRHPGIHTVIFGHSHLCRYRQYRNGRMYINTGTWNELTNLDLNGFGRSLRLTYAYLEWESPEKMPVRLLKQWKGRWSEEEETYG